jgi:hypothetical protein
MFKSKARAYLSEAPFKLSTLGEPLGACIIKLFTSVIDSVVQYASAVAIVSHFLVALRNTLAFYVLELTTAVISFCDTGPWPNSQILD